MTAVKFQSQDKNTSCCLGDANLITFHQGSGGACYWFLLGPVKALKSELPAVPCSVASITCFCSYMAVTFGAREPVEALLST